MVVAQQSRFRPVPRPIHTRRVPLPDGDEAKLYVAASEDPEDRFVREAVEELIDSADVTCRQRPKLRAAATMADYLGLGGQMREAAAAKLTEPDLPRGERALNRDFLTALDTLDEE